MPEHASDNDTGKDEPARIPSYEAPVVEDLETVDGPAVTAAAKSPV